MYRCSTCREVVGPGQRQHKVIMGRRRRVYAPRPEAFQVVKKGKRQWVNDPGGSGWEIVREAAVCGPCRRAQTS
jgi:hypothetical protein